MTNSRYGVSVLVPGTSQFWLHSMAHHAKSVLDVGCSTGGLATALMAEGKRVVGVDIDPEAVADARAAGVDARVLDLESTSLALALGAERFDCVVFGDVLEHLRDPSAALSDAAQLLTDDGFVLASVPNVTHASVRLSLLANRWDMRDTGVLDRTHLRFFTLEALDDLAASSGYLISRVERTASDLRDPSQASVSALRDVDLLPEWIKMAAEFAPEADTLQFVVRLDPVETGEDARREVLLRTRTDLRDALRRQRALEARVAKLEQTHEAAQAAVRDNLRLRDQNIGLTAQVGSLRYRLASVEAQGNQVLEGVLGSPSWRLGRLMTSPARLVRGALRRLRR